MKNPKQIELGVDALPGSRLCFWVRDNGKGIGSLEQSHLFQPFTQLNQVHARGYGLGLSIVRRIIEKLGGSVGVESQPGQGSRFYFTLSDASQLGEFHEAGPVESGLGELLEADA